MQLSILFFNALLILFLGYVAFQTRHLFVGKCSENTKECLEFNDLPIKTVKWREITIRERKRDIDNLSECFTTKH